MASDSTELKMVETESHEHVHPKLPFSCSSACSFSNQESHAAHRSKTIVKLSGLVVFYTVVMIIEIFGGLKANSLAILTDAAHLLSDIAGFSISIFAVWVSGWEATPQQSFGYNRLEVLGALLSVQLIWIVSATLIYEAVNRLVAKNTLIDGRLMFLVAAFGFLVNGIMVAWLGHDHSTHHHHSHHSCKHEKEELCAGRDEEEIRKLVATTPDQKTETMNMNINIQGAYLHLVTDLIQSVGVMVAGFVIWLKPEWLFVDLLCTVVFSVVSLSTTLSMLNKIFSVLMERAPSEIDVASFENGLKRVGGVCDVHDLHVWAITVGKYVMSCHVKIEPGTCPDEILHLIRTYSVQTFGIHHVTIQIEQDL